MERPRETPFLEAVRVYESEPCARPLAADILLHVEHGWLVARPDLLAFGRPVDSRATYGLITNPAFRFANADAFWIYFASGNLVDLIGLLPQGYPLIGFERGNVPRFWPVERFQRLAARRSINGSHCIFQGAGR